MASGQERGDNNNSKSKSESESESNVLFYYDERISAAAGSERTPGEWLAMGGSGMQVQQQTRPLILITEDDVPCAVSDGAQVNSDNGVATTTTTSSGDVELASYAGKTNHDGAAAVARGQSQLQQQQLELDSMQLSQASTASQQPAEQFEEIDGIRYRIVAAVTKPARPPPVIIEHMAASDDDADGDMANPSSNQQQHTRRKSQHQQQQSQAAAAAAASGGMQKKLSSAIRRKSSAMVAGLSNLLGPSASNHELGNDAVQPQRTRRLSVYEMTKSPPPETSLEIYLSERRRSSTISSKQVQQQLEQQSTFETNYCQRQQYFKDLNQKLINQDKKLLNVVANRGQIHRHSVDIAQLPLHLAQAKASKAAKVAAAAATSTASKATADVQVVVVVGGAETQESVTRSATNEPPIATDSDRDCDRDRDESKRRAINQLAASPQQQQQPQHHHHKLGLLRYQDRSLPLEKRGSASSQRGERHKKSRIVIRKFQKLDQSVLHSTPAPDVKIGQRVAYKEYYGNEFGTIRWIGRVPQICPDWTVGVEFDNAIGEGDGSLNGRRYFIAKDCFAKFLSLNDVALVDQHVGRPEPGTMISVMSAAVRPGQMISIQRVSTVHVQHCFLNAPHQIPGADILAVNTRLHCQCPNCGPCAHVIKPPRTQRIARAGKNATHMCQFSTYTCCGMESQEETMCTYKGNKAASLPPPTGLSSTPLPQIGNSWFEGAGYLSQLQAQQSKLMPEEYRLGAAPEDIGSPETMNRRFNRSSSRRGSGKRNHRHREPPDSNAPTPVPINTGDQAGWNPNNDESQQAPQPGLEEPYICHENAGQNSAIRECPPSYTPPDPNSSYNSNQNKFAVVPCADKANWVEPVWCEPRSDPAPEKNLPKSAKVVYRDSIENRYLFPTDDPIDSKLEADLENLSQARYGHSTNSRLTGTRSIFKSLRSLVSCLSAQSNHSELDGRSEETMRFSDHRGKVGDSTNKAIPPIMPNNKPREFCDAQNSNSNYYTNNIGNITDNNMSNHSTSTSSESTKEEKENLNFFDSSCKIDRQKHVNTIIGCEDVRRHISSSSDCGFSSASQNSIPNFHQSIYAKPCSAIISDEEERKRLQIYQNFLDQLVTSTTIKNDDLNSLERILFRQSHERFCMHSKFDALQPSSYDGGIFDQQHTLVDRFKRSCLQPKSQTSFVNLPRAASACCHSANHCITSQKFDMDDRSSDRLNSDIDTKRHKQMKNHEKIATADQNAKSWCGNSSISGSATLSSDESIKGVQATLAGSDNQSTVSSNLPKAFELKLTLSINSEKTNGQNCESENNDVDSNQIKRLDLNPLNGSTFKINIVANDEGRKTKSIPDDGCGKETIEDEMKLDATNKLDQSGIITDA